MKNLHWTRSEDTEAWVRTFTAQLKRPCAVLLAGPLGAGKTQIVRWFASELGAPDGASPTFAIHQEYETASGTIDHVDLYRLNSDADLESSGFWDFLRRNEALIFVEWADRLPEDVWPAGWRRVFIDLSVDSNGARNATVRVLDP